MSMDIDIDIDIPQPSAAFPSLLRAKIPLLPIYRLKNAIESLILNQTRIIQDKS